MKKQKKTIKQLIDGVMEEFDEKFESRIRVGNEQEGFWWKLNTDNPDVIKSFLRQSLLKIAKARIKAI